MFYWWLIIILIFFLIDNLSTDDSTTRKSKTAKGAHQRISLSLKNVSKSATSKVHKKKSRSSLSKEKKHQPEHEKLDEVDSFLADKTNEEIYELVEGILNSLVTN